MADAAQPSLFILAGPNGAGKSTLYSDRIKPVTRAPFINADEIAREWADEGIEYDAYAASREAAVQRQRLMHERRSFVTETVFSHPSKLALVETALAAGYRVVLYHVHVRVPEMSVARVAARTVVGGHAVPEHKIRERYERNPSLIRQAAARASATLVFDKVFDNSKRGHPPQWLLSMEHGVVTAQTDMPTPDWAACLYL